VGHRLLFTTRTQISGCLVPFLLTCSTMILCSLEIVEQGPLLSWKIKTWLPNRRVIHWGKVDHLSRFPVFFPLTSDVMSTLIRSCYKGFLDGRQACGGLVISEWIGQLSWAIIFSMSLSMAAFLWRAGGLIKQLLTGLHQTSSIISRQSKYLQNSTELFSPVNKVFRYKKHTIFAQ